MKWKHLPIVAFDCETTGLRPFAGDRVIEFAAVQLWVDDEGRVRDRADHQWMINPGVPIPREITQVTGIRDEDVAYAPPFETVAEDIRSLFVDAITVAHNYPFDRNFLSAECDRLGLSWPEPMAEIDTLDVSIRCFQDKRSHKLNALCERLGVKLDQHHRATDDAAACGECFLELVRRRDIPDDLQPMLEWAGALGRPPAGGPFVANDEGLIVFAEGPHSGQPIGQHPKHLAWMDQARERTQDGWRFTYSESARAWARTWLKVRGSGRRPQNPKGFGRDDWVMDSCITLDRRTPG